MIKLSKTNNLFTARIRQNLVEKEIFEMISGEPVHFDHLIEKSGIHAGELSATLTLLELSGIVERLPGDWYSRQSSITTAS